MRKSRKKWDVLMACGGTFGHIRPILTLAEALEKEGYSVALICAEKDKKFPLIKERHAEQMFFLRIRGFPTRKNIFLWIRFFFGLLGGLWKTGRIFLFQRPSYVIVSGSFVSYPPLFWARLLRVPYSILEQNTIPGFVSRSFFKKARHVFFALPPLAKNYLNNPVAQVTGNPLTFPPCSRTEAFDFFHFDANLQKRTVVGIIGGSLGARALIEWAINQKPFLESEGIFLFCITGKEMFPIYGAQASPFLFFTPFVKDMVYFYSLCDFIVSRAGASTISELLYFRKPAFFVPYPFATQKHQDFNAEQALKYLPGERISEDSLSDYSIVQIIAILKQKVQSFVPPKKEDWDRALEKIVNIVREEI